MTNLWQVGRTFIPTVPFEKVFRQFYSCWLILNLVYFFQTAYLTFPSKLARLLDGITDDDDDDVVEWNLILIFILEDETSDRPRVFGNGVGHEILAVVVAHQKQAELDIGTIELL